jgi:uncharacterized protein YndB with AHSA1/START domain
MKNKNTFITVKVSVKAGMQKTWNLWTLPEHIVKWNNASKEWHTPLAENDLRPGGKFTYRMEAKDGSFGFDFWGIYDEIDLFNHIIFTLGDERKVKVTFTSAGDKTTVTEVFETESENTPELQRTGWQAILDNFKLYVESNK